jgi:hypothetical protein
MVGSGITGGGDATTSQGREVTAGGQQRQAESRRQMRAAAKGRRGLPERGRQEAETVHERQTRTNVRRDERRWWAADDVTRVADDDGRRTMMSGDKRS